MLCRATSILKKPQTSICITLIYTHRKAAVTFISSLTFTFTLTFTVDFRYTGRGLFLHPPYVALVRGKWQVVDPPAWLLQPPAEDRGGRVEAAAGAIAAGPLAATASWSSLEEVLSCERDTSEASAPWRRLYRYRMQFV